MTPTLPQNPFPGMNPYLENLGLWHQIQFSTIVELSKYLAVRLRPDYLVSIRERMYAEDEPYTGKRHRFQVLNLEHLGPGATTPELISSPPAEPMPNPGAIAVQTPWTEMRNQRYLEVMQHSSREVIAVIEMLYPFNKSENRNGYLARREEILQSSVHFVEIDLLRSGSAMPVIGEVPGSDYRILVKNARLMGNADLYCFGVRERIPEFVMPLAAGSPGVLVDMNPVLDHVYSYGSFDLDIDYHQDPQPPLSNADRAWINQLLHAQGLRKPAL